MSKFYGIFVFIFFAGLFSCHSENGNIKEVSLVSDSAKIIAAKLDSIRVQSASSANEVKSILSQLPVLKFQLILNVDSFLNKKRFPITLNKNLPWFADFLEFSSGTKACALGKYYVDGMTQAVLLLTESPSVNAEQPEKVQLILSLMKGNSGAMDSRIVSVRIGNAFGNTLMKTPNKGKSFVNQPGNQIDITLLNFIIKDGAFVLRESINKKFTGDKKGIKESNEDINNWMK
ncbi:MAG: hypothetical protein NT084_14540 [Bacteroidetes bacterium]|jgi:hypothetical protein|nr:hypothetical protein [Bacteroidota bacterium]